eukprot:3298056-Amphidinium_carterae.1
MPIPAKVHLLALNGMLSRWSDNTMQPRKADFETLRSIAEQVKEHCPVLGIGRRVGAARLREQLPCAIITSGNANRTQEDAVSVQLHATEGMRTFSADMFPPRGACKYHSNIILPSHSFWQDIRDLAQTCDRLVPQYSGSSSC